MGNGRGQLNMPHALAAHFGQRYFHAAFFTGYTFKFQAFVFTTQAFVVFHWPENFGAEQAIALGFERAVVNGFGLFHFAV